MLRQGTMALAFLVSASIAQADVIPARYADPLAAADRARIAGRLAGLGMTDAESEARTAALTDDDARYFAAAPQRVRAAGRDDGTENIPGGEKTVLGVTFLGAAIAGIAVAAAQH